MKMGRDSVRPSQTKKLQARGHHWALEEEEEGRVPLEGLWRGHGPADPLMSDFQPLEL